MLLNKKNDLTKKKIGFIGVGIMGEGMVYKLIEANHKLFVKKNKNPNPINRVKKKGAFELKTIKEIVKKCEIIILCLPNSSVAKKIILEIGQTCSKKKLVIDCTTNNYNSVLYFKKLSKIYNFNYVEAPISGGSLQAKNGNLGAFIGSNKKNFRKAKQILKPCCKKILRIGKIGMGTKAKLISNFLALGTTTLVIESLKIAKKLSINWKKFYKLSSLGSGSSKSLDRIAPKALQKDYDSYLFTIENTIKDLNYMIKIFKEYKDIKKITRTLLKFYVKDKKKYGSKAFISNRLKE